MFDPQKRQFLLYFVQSSAITETHSCLFTINFCLRPAANTLVTHILSGKKIA